MKQTISRRALLGTAAFAALSLTGCSNQPSDNGEPSESKKDSQQVKTAEVGQRITFDTPDGELAVTVDGFVVSKTQTDRYLQYGELPSDMAIGLLKLIIENVSYDNGYDQYVSLDPSLYCEDDGGVGMSTRSSCYEYEGGYEAIAGAYLELREGQSKRIALPYDVDPSMASVTVVAGDTEVKVDVAQE